MIKKLTYQITFPLTGRTLTEAIEFQDGIGVITGPNEAGKSFIFEMIRFCLFGSAAVRGKNEDYKNLKASLEWSVKGEDYAVKRTITTAKLFRGEDQIATSTSAVNNRIMADLGFSLDVFDIGCVANQNELLKLGEMKPTERKRIVDSVIGLGVLDDISRSAGVESLALTRRADDLEAMLVLPSAPIVPMGYEPSMDLAKRVAELKELKTEYNQLQGEIKNSIQEPKKPTGDTGIESSSIQDFLDVQNELRAKRTALEEQVRSLPEASNWTDAELDAIEHSAEQYALYMEKQRFLHTYEIPQFTRADLAVISYQWDAWEQNQKIEQATKELVNLRARGTLHCPNCKYIWEIAADEIEIKEWSIEELKKLPYSSYQPAITRRQIDNEITKIITWERMAPRWSVIKDYPDSAKKPKIDTETIYKYRFSNNAAASREGLMSQIKELDHSLERQPDYRKLLKQQMEFEAASVVWQEQKVKWDEWNTRRGQIQPRLLMLKMDLQELPHLESLLSSALLYEQARVLYENAKSSYGEGMALVSELRAEAAEWNKGKQSMALVRGKVKQFLVPSLNVVASQLIREMTGGQRQVVEVDDDFNIKIDNQPIDTLSGSGKAVANLAIRVGLGQVLTNNVLSLFMGDEIDNSFDKDRAENTTNSLQKLRNNISQILLITHKYVQSDYDIRVGNE